MEKHVVGRISHPTAGTSRRGVVGSVIGGVAALITGVAGLKAEPGGNGKGNGWGQEKGQGQEKSTGKATGKGQGKISGKAKGKVWLCHKPDPITLRGTVIQVSASTEGDQIASTSSAGIWAMATLSAPQFSPSPTSRAVPVR